MKMTFAGLATSPNSAPENFRFNCTRNKSCQREFFIPVNGICDFMLYFEMGFMPETYTVDLIDSCSGIAAPAAVVNYVFGEHTAGIYGVFGGLVAANVPSQFFVKVSFFHHDGREAIYYSNDFEVVTCEALTKISSCYNDPAEGVPAFDVNGVYYGYPIGTNFLGNRTFRYYHFIFVRKASVTNTKTKISLNAFNYTKIYKAQATQQYNFFSEAVPEFYKEEIVAVLIRGNILINGKGFQMAEENDLSILDEDSKLWGMQVILNKVLFNYFSCRGTLCNFDPCAAIPVPEPETCCEPVVIGQAVEVVSDTPTDPGYPCNKYFLSGNDENSSYSYVICETGETVETPLGRGVVYVCSRSRPVGDGVSIAEAGSC